MTLLDRVKNLCGENSLTLAKLEKTLGFGNGTLSRWDDSSPSGEKLIKVANFFNVSVDYLIGNVDYLKIGIKIKNKRNTNKVAVSTMVHRLGVTIDKYLSIEKGSYEPPLKVYVDICEMFNFTLDEIFPTQLNTGNIDKESSDLNDKFNDADLLNTLNFFKYRPDVSIIKSNEYEREVKNKAFFIDMCSMIGFSCSEYTYKSIPGFIVYNNEKNLFIPRDNAFLLLENIKDHFYIKLGNTLCYSEEILDNESIVQENIRIQLNAAHANGEPTEEEIQQTNEIMDNDKNWD